jgi:hypothetical protein
MNIEKLFSRVPYFKKIIREYYRIQLFTIITTESNENYLGVPLSFLEITTNKYDIVNSSLRTFLIVINKKRTKRILKLL